MTNSESRPFVDRRAGGQGPYEAAYAASKAFILTLAEART